MFILADTPTESAQQHQDVHAGKMLLEATQLLCTSFPLPTEDFDTWHRRSPVERMRAGQLPYARTPSQYAHPCAVWTRWSTGNFSYVLDLAEALSKEFQFRFDKEHGSTEAVRWVRLHQAEADVPMGPREAHTLQMPKQYKGPDPVAAYRAYYAAEKRGHMRRQVWVPATWTRREVPAWFKEAA